MAYEPNIQGDTEVAKAIEAEVTQQEETLAMIASENHVSEDVLAAQGSPFTNIYAEGYPGERYYGGCENADTIEQLAITRAQELYGAEHVNVQPHSGTQANMGVYFAVLDPGDKILSLDLNHGGHLSHGHPANFSGTIYNVKQYSIDPETGLIDYEELHEAAKEFQPDIIVSGYSAYPRIVDWERVQSIADEVNAYHLSDIAHITGLVAADVHPSPVGIADFVTGSTHKTIRAGRGGFIMTDDEFADDIDKAVFPGMQGGPLMHNIAGKAVGFGEALQPDFEKYAQQTVENAKALGASMSEQGFSLVSGGTDTHLILVDLRESHPEVTGHDAEKALEKAGIILNANTVPGETRSAKEPSGIRIGTPGLTSRGFTEEDITEVGQLIGRTIDNIGDETTYEEVRQDVRSLTQQYPLYK